MEPGLRGWLDIPPDQQDSQKGLIEDHSSVNEHGVGLNHPCSSELSPLTSLPPSSLSTPFALTRSGSANRA